MYTKNIHKRNAPQSIGYVLMRFRRMIAVRDEWNLLSVNMRWNLPLYLLYMPFAREYALRRVYFI